jgi:hypothetical protein
VLDRLVHAPFLEQQTAQRNLRARVSWVLADGILKRLFGLRELRLAGVCAGLEQRISEQSEQPIIRDSFANCSTHNLRGFGEVAKHAILLSGCKVTDCRIGR